MKIIKFPNTGWDYSNMSKAASNEGGVKKFLSGIYNKGAIKGSIVTGIIIALSAVIGIGIKLNNKDLKFLIYK